MYIYLGIYTKTEASELYSQVGTQVQYVTLASSPNKGVGNYVMGNFGPMKKPKKENKCQG